MKVFTVSWIVKLCTAILVVLIMIIALSVAPVQAQNNPFDKHKPVSVTLYLRWLHQFQFAGYYAALEKGYYRNAGLNVTIVEGGPGRDPVEAVMSGPGNYGASNPGILLERMKGRSLVVLAAIFQHSASALLVRKDSRITSPHDLIGRRVMLQEHFADAEILAMFLSEGIPFDKIQRQSISFNPQDLIDGKTDAFSAYLSNEPFYLTMKGVAPHLIRPATYGIDFYGDCLFTSEWELKEHPERVKAFRAASLCGWEYAMAHQDEIVELILSKYPSEGKTREHLAYEAKTMDELLIPNVIEMGHMNPGRWQRIADTYVNLGMAKPGYELAGFMYDPDPKRDISGIIRITALAIGISVLAVVIALVLLRFNRRLRREVIQRQQVEQELRQSEKRLRTLINATPDIVCFKDGEGRWLEANDAALELFDLQGMEYRGKKDAELAQLSCRCGGTVLASGETDEETWEGGEPSLAEGIIPAPDGITRSYDIVKAPVFHADGSRSGLLILARDITERKKMFEERFKIQQFESLGTLAGGIAHDFNNLLMGILGNISLVQTSLEPSGSDFKLLGEAEKASLQAKMLARSLITFTKSGDPMKNTENVGEILRDAVNLALTGSDLSSQVNVPEDLWFVDCDKGQIYQMIANIVINAKEAMPGGGVIEIEARNEQLADDKILSLGAGRYVRFSVRDHGKGIPSEHLEKIFTPYFSTKQRGAQKGMGLGLTTAYSIVKRHNGHIAVGSEMNVGTVVSVYLPASEKNAIEPTIDETGHIAGSGKVLVMDDEEMVRDLARKMLSLSGYEVDVAEDGKAAIEKYKTAKAKGVPFDAVILDLTVRGGMGGSEALKELLKTENDVKAIVSSGYSTDPMLSDYHQYGFKGALSKPYGIRELLNVVQNVISDSR